MTTSVSPNGKMVAIVFSRDCGATTGFSLQVSIVPKGTAAKERGNALILDRKPTYSNAYKPVWTDENSVTLFVPKGARVFKQNKKVAGVEVSYKEL